MYTRICDKCGKPLKIEKKKDVFGNEVNVFVSHPIHPFCNEFESREFDLCETCATAIDLALTNLKLQILLEVEKQSKGARSAKAG